MIGGAGVGGGADGAGVGPWGGWKVRYAPLAAAKMARETVFVAGDIIPVIAQSPGVGAGGGCVGTARKSG